MNENKKSIQREKSFKTIDDFLNKKVISQKSSKKENIKLISNTFKKDIAYKIIHLWMGLNILNKDSLYYKEDVAYFVDCEEISEKIGNSQVYRTENDEKYVFKEKIKINNIIGSLSFSKNFIKNNEQYIFKGNKLFTSIRIFVEEYIENILIYLFIFYIVSELLYISYVFYFKELYGLAYPIVLFFYIIFFIFKSSFSDILLKNKNLGLLLFFNIVVFIVLNSIEIDSQKYYFILSSILIVSWYFIIETCEEKNDNVNLIFLVSIILMSVLLLKNFYELFFISIIILIFGEKETNNNWDDDKWDEIWGLFVFSLVAIFFIFIPYSIFQDTFKEKKSDKHIIAKLKEKKVEKTMPSSVLKDVVEEDFISNEEELIECKYYMTTAKLNIRERPTTLYSKIKGQLKKFQQVCVIDKKDNWYFIRDRGWVFKKYLKN